MDLKWIIHPLQYWSIVYMSYFNLMLKLLDVFFHLYLIYDCYNDLCILICICFMIVSEIKNKKTNNQWIEIPTYIVRDKVGNRSQNGWQPIKSIKNTLLTSLVGYGFLMPQQKSLADQNALTKSFRGCKMVGDWSLRIYMLPYTNTGSMLLPCICKSSYSR